MSPLRILGLAGLLVLALLAVIGPDITGFDPARQDLRAILVPPGTDGHILGTDHLGRDLAARLVEGARITLALAAFAVASAASSSSLGAWRSTPATRAELKTTLETLGVDFKSSDSTKYLQRKLEIWLDEN